ncbi:BRE1-domain-containing protein [Marasmius fiardii PR-910]|nr:BRE1-domain-containing protein [Marasmius fiardii PR-910]
MSTARKRSRSIESESASVKKHIMTDENGAPHVSVNGVVNQQEDMLELSGRDKLEMFRKEAIYRRMKHYSRESERYQARIAELEERKITCDAGLAAMSACWQQLVDALGSIAPDEEPPTTDDIRDLYNISTYVTEDTMPELRSSLERTQKATTRIVSKLLGKPGASANIDTQSRRVQAESAALRTQLDMLQVKLQDTEETSQRYKEALSVAENRLERMNSKTVQEVQPKRDIKPEEEEERMTEKEQRKPSSPEVSGQRNGDHAEHARVEEGYWQDIADNREKRIQELEQQVYDLTGRLRLAEIQLEAPTTAQVLNHAHFKLLMTRLSQASLSLQEKDLEIGKLKNELQESEKSNKQAEELLKANAAHEVSELKTAITMRDTNLARLRENRDQQGAELHERRLKDSARIASCEEYKTLAASRAERISVLNSQLKRCRLQLAAQANREDIISLLMEDPNGDVSYVEELHQKFSNVKERLATLEQACSNLDEDNPDIARHVQAEAEALQKLSDVSAQLERYRTVYGEFSSLQPDVSQLASQLQQKEDELQRFRLLDKQREQTETMLYAEVEKLSAAWEALDTQVKGKVFDLTAMEDKLAKVLTEKAKAENKFYASMRDKESIELERRNLARTLERHGKAVEALKENEAKLNQQITLAQKLLSSREEQSRIAQREIAEFRQKHKETESMLHDEKAKYQSALKCIQGMENQTLHLQRQLQQRIEESARSKKDLQRQTLKLQSKERLLSSRARTVDHDADTRKILRCSTCNINFRKVLLTKCWHTFCKDCIEARISTRQRKCPACNLAFGQSDVQTIFFQ